MMSTIATTLAFLVMALGANPLITANHDGIPGRRVGGGTRHEAPLPIMLVPKA